MTSLTAPFMCGPSGRSLSGSGRSQMVRYRERKSRAGGVPGTALAASAPLRRRRPAAANPSHRGRRPAEVRLAQNETLHGASRLPRERSSTEQSDDRLWVVTDPTRESEAGDICFETTVRGLLLQLKGGLDIERNVTLFTEKNEAELEAFGRLTAMRASRAIAERLRFGPGAGVPERIEILDGEGRVLFEAELRHLPAAPGGSAAQAGEKKR